MKPGKKPSLKPNLKPRSGSKKDVRFSGKDSMNRDIDEVRQMDNSLKRASTTVSHWPGQKPQMEETPVSQPARGSAASWAPQAAT